MPRGACVIFDMDGTLTRPVLNFDDIRAALALPAGPILEQLPAMPPKRRDEIERALYRYEMESAVHSELQPGAGDLIRAINAAGLRTALLTRSCRSAVDVLLLKHPLKFDALHTREDGPPKPSAEPIIDLCTRLNVAPTDTWMVGDFHYDIIAGRAAGATTVLLVNDRAIPTFADEADHVIHRLDELPALLGIRGYAASDR